MSRPHIPTDELRALRPLETEEVQKHEAAARRPALVEAVRELKVGLSPGEDPFHPKAKEREDAPPAAPSEAREYLPPSMIPESRGGPLADEPKVDVDGRRAATQKVLRHPDGTPKGVGGTMKLMAAGSGGEVTGLQDDEVAAPGGHQATRWQSKYLAIGALALALGLVATVVGARWLLTGSEGDQRVPPSPSVTSSAVAKVPPVPVPLAPASRQAPVEASAEPSAPSSETTSEPRPQHTAGATVPGHRHPPQVAPPAASAAPSAGRLPVVAAPPF